MVCAVSVRGPVRRALEDRSAAGGADVLLVAALLGEEGDEEGDTGDVGDEGEVGDGGGAT